MQDLINQEQFEIEVLDLLNSKRLLNNLIFCGGTMLRLCYGLDRFSVDLDFWLMKKTGVIQLFNKIVNLLSSRYTLSDAQNKFHTLLFEVRSKKYPRGLKIEIRKEPKKVGVDRVIAFSRHANVQVMINAVSLTDMMNSKVQAFITRKEIRDAFDIEFLLKKGIRLPNKITDLEKLKATIAELTKRDYTVKLGSVLEAEPRKYYTTENFKILKITLQDKLGGSG
jgi:predicted nucleotidyltransferase component of viral defense system